MRKKLHAKMKVTYCTKGKKPQVLVLSLELDVKKYFIFMKKYKNVKIFLVNLR